MGLYLCIFDDYDEELCGVEVGQYNYFSRFRNQVARLVDEKVFSSDMSVLLQHQDCDGNWDTDDCKRLLPELEEIKQVFSKLPPLEEIYELKSSIFKLYGIIPKNLFECFIDSDCEFLVDRMRSLCEQAIEVNHPISFQ